MEAIKVAVRVSASTAVRGGSPLAGRATVTLTEEHLAALAPTERAHLAEVLGAVAGAVPRDEVFGIASRTVLGLSVATPVELPSADTSAPAVVEALRARLRAEAEAYDAAVRADRKELASVVDRAFAVELSERCGFDVGERWGLSLMPDERLQRAVKVGIPRAAEAAEHLRNVAAEAADRNVADVRGEARRYCSLPVEARMRCDADGDWEAVGPLGCRPYVHDVERKYGAAAAEAFTEAHVAAIARTTEARASREAAMRRAKEAVVAFARTIPELKRAADEGYDVRRGVADEIARRVASMPSPDGTMAPAEVYAQGGRGWNVLDWEDAPSPSSALFALRDSVERHVANVLAQGDHPEGVTITVARVARVTTADDDGGRDNYTGEPATRKRRGIVVNIDGLVIPQRVVVFPAE